MVTLTFDPGAYLSIFTQTFPKLLIRNWYRLVGICVVGPPTSNICP